MKYKHLSYSDRQEMEKLYLQGWHMNDIAEKLGVSLATVYHEPTFWAGSWPFCKSRMLWQQPC